MAAVYATATGGDIYYWQTSAQSATTTTGVGGSLSGGQGSAVEPAIHRQQPVHARQLGGNFLGQLTDGPPQHASKKTLPPVFPLPKSASLWTPR